MELVEGLRADSRDLQAQCPTGVRAFVLIRLEIRVLSFDAQGLFPNLKP